MAKILGAALLNSIFNGKKSGLFFALVYDVPFFKAMLKHTLSNAEDFQGIAGFEDAIDAVATPGLFGEPAPIVLTLEKVTASQWKKTKDQLSRLPKPLDGLLWILVPTSLRQVVTEAAFSGYGQTFICWNPTLPDRQKMLLQFMATLPQLQKFNSTARQGFAEKCEEFYADDLTSSTQHLKRMATGSLNFEDALLDQTQLNTFHILDALVAKQLEAFSLRMRQCEAGGEKATTTFAGMLYFLKQLALVLAEKQKGIPEDMALKKARVPFPSQGRMRLAMRNISPKSVYFFFREAPDLEVKLRVQKDAWSYLELTLIKLFFAG